eukprot:CAMPEP_0116139864 /NCGR_PEP_ID=MMETSP0329-20121206/13536_1 /TAXON_ID=697910 /ORGANISM="Pseudo-nitzschia arenysensis, Strain B593" /LENGTH=292 /DNA_ID=CAMNT_0003634929 /DNA_START=546 /DNA_END=1424 /DNA_ORIENTATION=+
MITSRSFRRYDHYPYDHLLFQANVQCETTKLHKIPRSKYDRMKYDGIVPRYDHFCGWTHNTYGEDNYRWFLMFLLNHVIMCFYGVYVSYLLFTEEIRTKRLKDLTFFDRQTGESLKGSRIIILQYMYARRTHEMAVALVMLVMGIALSLFLGYHVYITSMGQTTNENAKWGDVRSWYTKQQKLYKQAVRDGKVTKKSTDGGKDIELSDTDSEEKKTDVIEDPGPVPKNIYDRGFVANWSEVFFPLSLQKDAISRGGFTAKIIEESKRATEANSPSPEASASSYARSTKPKDI